MKRIHFEALAPRCLYCRSQGHDSRLVVGHVVEAHGDDVLQGVLHCAAPGCQAEYPIIDGVPIIMLDVRTYLAENLPHIEARDDLSPYVESLLADGTGPTSSFDATRRFLSSYAWDHYADLDPEDGEPYTPGSVRKVQSAAFDLLGLELSPGAALDLGCSVGRTTFDLANRCEGLVVGVDVNFSMLRLARRALVDGVVSYPRRRVGVVYDRRTFEVDLPHRERVDFWCCDALALPFADDTFQLTSALNVFDCVQSPQGLLVELGRTLAPGGGAAFATPFDWSAGATPLGQWIGGHSQRGPHNGAAEPFLRTLLTPGAHPLSVSNLSIAGEIDRFPWHVRLHDRSEVVYQAHVLGLRGL